MKYGYDCNALVVNYTAAGVVVVVGVVVVCRHEAGFIICAVSSAHLLLRQSKLMAHDDDFE